MLPALSQTAQNELANLITLLLGITISFSMRADAFVRVDTLLIMGIGLIAFIFDTIGGVLFAKIYEPCFLKTKINPMIGAAGISHSRCPHAWCRSWRWRRKREILS